MSMIEKEFMVEEPNPNSPFQLKDYLFYFLKKGVISPTDKCLYKLLFQDRTFEQLAKVNPKNNTHISKTEKYNVFFKKVLKHMTEGFRIGDIYNSSIMSFIDIDDSMNVQSIQSIQQVKLASSVRNIQSQKFDRMNSEKHIPSNYSEKNNMTKLNDENLSENSETSPESTTNKYEEYLSRLELLVDFQEVCTLMKGEGYSENLQKMFPELRMILLRAFEVFVVFAMDTMSVSIEDFEEYDKRI